MYQKLIIIGNVTEPEIRDVNGSKVANFRLAASEKYTDRNGELHESTEWFSIVCWRKQAELVEKYVRKGDLIFVDGKMRTRKYTNKDGDERSITEVLPDVIKFASKKDKPADIPQTQDDDIPF